jgi:hypothetical protein
MFLSLSALTLLPGGLKATPVPGSDGPSTASAKNGIRYTADFVWSESPTEDLSTPGEKTVNLSACPSGVKGDQPEYWIYISGKGTAEAVKVEGGTCKGDGRAGTLQFTTAHAHAAGYAIGSASDGLQEASIAASFQPANPTAPAQGGRVMVTPGTELRLYARVSIRASYQVVDFSGAIFECYMADTCVYVGDPKYSNRFNNVTLVNPRGRPMVAGNTKPMIETNAQSTRIINVSAREPGNNGTFGAYVQVDDDQAFLLDGLDSASRGIRCDPDFCGSYVTAPGPFNVGSAVGWLKNMNLSPQCHGNGVDWQSGNTLRISDSVIQGFQQFGVRTGVRRGGYGGTELDNVYMEEGRGCGIDKTGAAGVIADGGVLTIRSDRNPQGQSPQFQNLGSTYYHYFVVASHPTFGDSMPLAAGWAKTDGTTPIEVTWPVIRGIKNGGHYKLLRMIWSEKIDKPSPLGTGNWLIGTIDSAACGPQRCSLRDTHAAAQPYTTVNAFTGPGPYYPVLDFWPGNIILSTGTDGRTLGSPAKLFIDNAPRDGIVSVSRYTDGPTVYAQSCQGGPGLGLGPTSYPAMECYEPGYSTWGLKRGILFQSRTAYDGQFTNYKGKLNFLTIGSGPSPLITWEDSDPVKTITDLQRRPPADVTDADTGMYGTGILYSRANKEIRSYIGKLPDAKPQESLTATLKAFSVPVSAPKLEGITDDHVVANLDADMVDGVRLKKFTGGKCLESSPDGSSIFEAPGRCGGGGNAGQKVEQFTYTFFDPHSVLTTAQQVPSIYVNLAGAFHIVGVYCEIDGGEAAINLQRDDGRRKSQVLASDLVCSTAGSTSTAIVKGNEAVASGQKLNHITAKASGNLHRMNVVVKYVEE